jgi:hypothetical protein
MPPERDAEGRQRGTLVAEGVRKSNSERTRAGDYAFF